MDLSARLLFFIQEKMEGTTKVDEFRAILNEFKRPFIERLTESSSAGQDVAKLNVVLAQLGKLYLFMKAVIDGDGVMPPGDTANGPIYKVFDTNGIIQAIKENPSLKDSFLRYLNLDLRVYPYTLSPKHISSLLNKRTQSHQNTIISNGSLENGT
jgi:hypothetical protein